MKERKKEKKKREEEERESGVLTEEKECPEIAQPGGETPRPGQAC